MKNVVMKFGGTSVADADAIRRLMAIVTAQAAKYRRAARRGRLGNVEGDRPAAADDGRCGQG